MNKEELIPQALLWTLCGILFFIFFFAKLGLDRKSFNNINFSSPQIQTALLIVDPALLDEPYPSRPESRAPASKSGILE